VIAPPPSRRGQALPALGETASPLEQASPTEQDSPSQRRNNLRNSLAPALLIVVAGILVYSNTFGVPFLFDDSVWIVSNPAIRHLWPLSLDLVGNSRFVAMYSFALNYAAHGGSV